MSNTISDRHQIQRVRRETRRRTLTVSSIERLGAKMLRLHFTSPDLGDFASASYDDHIKLFFPGAKKPGDEKSPARDFTPRRFDTQKGTFVIDFAVHDAGPATEWAVNAKVGDTLEIGGPRGSQVIPDDFDWYLLIGDETALPAIGRRVEELRPGVPVTTVVVGDAQDIPTKAAWSPKWIARQAQSDDAALIRAALVNHDLPDGEGFVWIAAEAAVAKAIRTYLVEERSHKREWIKAHGYWKRGLTEVHERFED
jgi:NADPH-dependent ferric siderophore reductase